MKKRLLSAFLIAALASSTLLVGGCKNSGGSESSESLTIFNYGEYIDPDVLDQFTEETGIEIKYEEALTPDELYTKYSSGAIEYDLVCTSDYMLQKLIAEGELQEIDINALENKDNIGEKYWEFSQAFDPENKYTVPHFWGTLGILYDTSKVSEPVESWDVLFNGKYAGDIIMQNSMRDSFMVALKYLGYSLNSDKEAEIQDAYDLLLAQKPDVGAMKWWPETPLWPSFIPVKPISAMNITKTWLTSFRKKAPMSGWIPGASLNIVTIWTPR